MRQLTEDLIGEGHLKTSRIIRAFEAVDRADFVPEEVKGKAYANIPLPIGFGQTISQPLTVAFMLELLAPESGDKILDVGSGSGWQTALLAYIVSHDEFGHELEENKAGYTPTFNNGRGKVIAIELIPELERLARKNIFKYNFIKKRIVEIHCLTAEHGFAKEAPFDRIISAASGKKVPEEWKDQLKVGGRMVMPVDSSIWLYIKKEDKNFDTKEFPGFAFVPFISS